MNRASLAAGFLLLAACSSAPVIEQGLQDEAARGNPQAQYQIGESYYQGVYSFFGNWADWQDAAHWFSLAAAQGHVKAQFRLSQYYFNARADYRSSFFWLQSPAREGIAEAQHWLGLHYAQGWGTPVDLVLAYKWLWLAFEGNVPDVIGDLAGLDWLVRRGGMTPEQIAEGQRLALQHQAEKGKSRPFDLAP